ncbi:unnamed protein product, partial [Pylaiella littoralis]
MTPTASVFRLKGVEKSRAKVAGVHSNRWDSGELCLTCSEEKLGVPSATKGLVVRGSDFIAYVRSSQVEYSTSRQGCLPFIDKIHSGVSDGLYTRGEMDHHI